MRSPLCRIPLLAVSVLAIGCVAAAPKVDMAKEKAAIDEVGRQFATAMNAKNVDAVMAFYTADARVLPTDMAALTTTQAIRDYLNSAIQSGMTNVQITSEFTEISPAGDFALDVGTFSATMNGAQVSKRYAVGLKKVDGAWKLFFDMDNAAAAAAAAAADSAS